ncbi:alkylmercury lyase family protein [Mycolicibacterium sp. CBMA 234]|uniref:alkylmercury lyase family protein n=1 Tax=Mycolicibacterium sp. CBMA 234 TaxID=1918495 RepID=UPI0013917186|nr:alkylmercury lyase family protein [Mycolicibacterium sp. CBMA 234]
MQIEVLTSPGCPNAAAARQTVTDCLAELGMDVPIVDRVGRYPSPTVLVDGVDVMRPEAGAPTGDACRLDLPTPQRVLDALRARTPQSVIAAAQQLPAAVRELHRAVLRGFLDRGQAHRDDLRPTSTALGVDLDDALGQLVSADLVHTGPEGQIEVAYPFSGRATGHTVRLAGHLPVAAMCAIDALGIPLMTGADGVIDSADPDTGAPIRVQRHGNEWTWQPVTAVVVVSHTDCCGTLANTVCRSITFHADPEHAQSHLDRHPELRGFVVGQDDAIALADGIFGTLLVD